MVSTRKAFADAFLRSCAYNLKELLRQCSKVAGGIHHMPL
jgi:hypothetical protein